MLTVYSRYKRVQLDKPESWTFRKNPALYERKVRRSRVFKSGSWEPGTVDLTKVPGSYLFLNSKKSFLSERTKYDLVTHDLDKRAKEANISWLVDKKWFTFITLTLDDRKTLEYKSVSADGTINFKSLQQYVPSYDQVGITRFKRNLYRTLNYLSGCPDDPYGECVWAMEEQLRGALHAHIISTCGPHCASIIPKIWLLGFCDVGKIEPELVPPGKFPKRQHVRYIMKYVHKDSQVGYYVREFDSFEEDKHWCPAEALDTRGSYSARMGRNYNAQQGTLDVVVEPKFTLDVHRIVEKGLENVRPD
jgi:hypothetical protein